MAFEKSRAPKGIDWAKELKVAKKKKESTSETARRLKCSAEAVRAARQRHARGVDKSRMIAGINWDRQPLGLRTDTALAEKLNVSPQTVRGARVRRGIPSATAVDALAVKKHSCPQCRVKAGSACKGARGKMCHEKRRKKALEAKRK